MIVSFDIDGVIADTKYYGEENWVNGGEETFYASLQDLPLRWPNLVPYINRLAKHHVVQFNTARRVSAWQDTQSWLNRMNFSKRTTLNCLGSDKHEFLMNIQPQLHFDDHQKFSDVPGFVHVWHKSWSDEPTSKQVSSADEIIERIAYEKAQSYPGTGQACGYCEA